MAGDTIEAAVRAFYRQQATSQNNAGVPAEDMAVSLMQALSLPTQAAASTHAANPQARLATPQGGLTSSDLNDLKNKDPQNKREDKPKAYLNYVFFDNQFNFVEDGSGVKQVDSDPNQLETLSSGQVVAKKTGYVYVYTSNESQQDVLFDNMGVTQITGPVLEETHYYPYGLTMAGISSTAPLQIENRFKFNGKELNHQEFSDGGGLEWYDYGARLQDPQLGRWWTVDPMADKFSGLSSYEYVTGNPISLTDPDGKDWYKNKKGNVVWRNSHDDEYEDDEDAYYNIGEFYSVQLGDHYYFFDQLKATKFGVNEINTFAGFESMKYQEWDGYILGFSKMYGADPNFVKSILLQENGGVPSAINNDPMTMFNPGDWSSTKDIGTQAETRDRFYEKNPVKQYANGILSIKSGIKWLYGPKKDAANDFSKFPSQSSTFPIDISKMPLIWRMANRYNGNSNTTTDMNGNILKQHYIYAQRAYMRYNNPNIYIPTGTGGKNQVDKYSPQKGY